MQKNKEKYQTFFLLLRFACLLTMAVMQPCDSNLLVWIDLEMSGLDLNIHTIVEIAVAITDFQLKNYIEGGQGMMN